MESDWEPEKYTDDYQENLQQVIKQKMKGETVEIEGEEVPMRAEVIDLAERLRQSLKIAGSKRSTASKKTPARGRRTAAKTTAKTRRKRAA